MQQPLPALPASALPRWYECRIPPPAIDAAAAALMLWLARALPAAQIWPAGGNAWIWLAALLPATAGSLIALAGLYAFWRRRTTPNPFTPARSRALATHGIYRHTRNPMYVGMWLILAGWFLWLGNAAALLPLAAAPLALNFLQIHAEERILRARFGSEYDAWTARTPRWFWNFKKRTA